MTVVLTWVLALYDLHSLSRLTVVYLLTCDNWFISSYHDNFSCASCHIVEIFLTSKFSLCRSDSVLLFLFNVILLIFLYLSLSLFPFINNIVYKLYVYTLKIKAKTSSQTILMYTSYTIVLFMQTHDYVFTFLHYTWLNMLDCAATMLCALVLVVSSHSL